jgi:hypothetical protein
MKLWLLTPNKKGSNKPWKGFYDVAVGFVVAAKNEAQARALAAEEAGGEGKDAWLKDVYSDCEPLKPTEAGVILRDFNTF